jgi:hypothetical protein
MAERFRHADHEDASTADLLKALSEQTTRLVRQEPELAKTELAVKGNRASVESVKEDVQWTKTRARQARR